MVSRSDSLAPTQGLLTIFVLRRMCHTSCIAASRTCVHRLAGDLRAAVRQTPFFVPERRSTLSHSSISATTFPPCLPVAISDSKIFSASSGGVDEYSSGLACVLYSFATHLASTLGFPGFSLSVSAHPVLRGALPVSREHVSLETLVYIMWRRMHYTSSHLALAHSSGSSHSPLSSSQCHPSHIEQLLLIVMHEFPQFHFARDSSLCSCRFHEQS